MKRNIAAICLSLLLIGTAAAAQTPLDLIDHARITASATDNTFLGLWPRETEDAAFTIRDNDPATSWKIPGGAATLQIDFAPVSPGPPNLGYLAAEWEGDPETPILVRALDHCGGQVLAEGIWTEYWTAFAFVSPVRAQCIELVTNNIGEAGLSELHVMALPVEEEARIGDLTAAQDNDVLSLSWDDAGPGTHHVRIHYVDDPDDELTASNLIGLAPPHGPCSGPSPLVPGLHAVAVPVAEDGSTGEIRSVDLMPRQAQVLTNSGVVEGFYGRPWSMAERRDLIVRMAQFNLGVMIYAPKEDPLHRDRWRQPYTTWEISRFTEYLQLGQKVGVIFSFGISPGRDMVLDDPYDRQALIDKLRPFVEKGFRHFTLLMDDIGGDLEVPIDGALGAGHAELADWLKATLTDLSLGPVDVWFVPTIYCTLQQENQPGGSDYLDSLAAMDPAIKIMWTGTNVFSPTLSAADLIDVTNRSGRAPVIWDNEHATDGGDAFWGKVYFEPFTQRDPDLVAATAGITANPMILGAADRLIVGSYASFIANAYGYDEIAALGQAAAFESGNPNDHALLFKLAQTFHGSGVSNTPAIGSPNNLALETAADNLTKALKEETPEAILSAGRELLPVAGWMASLQSRLHHSGLDPALVDDLWYPVQEVQHQGLALLDLLDCLGAKLAGSGENGACDSATGKLRKSLLRDRYKSSFLTALLLNRKIGKTEIPPTGFTALEIQDPVTSPGLGEVWSYAPLADGVKAIAVNVWGLPGAETKDGLIQWLPMHAGTYHVVVTAATDNGWGSKSMLLVVGLPEEEPPDDDDDSDDDNDDDDDGCGI